MKRSVKNIVSVVLIIFLFSLIFLTMNYAKNHSSFGDDFYAPGGSIEDMPSNIPEGEMNSENDMADVPEKPDGEENTSNENGEMDVDGSTPPDMPNEENMEQNGDGNSDFGMGEAPDIPEGEDFDSGMFVGDLGSASLSFGYYIVFGLESLVVSGLIMYLLLSLFHKKSFKETFSSGDKVIIYILSVIILTGIFTYFSGKLTNDYFLNSSSMKEMIDIGEGSSDTVSYSAATEITEETTIESGEYSSDIADENSILVSGGIAVALSNITVDKSGDSDGGDTASFYGTNSAILAKGGANLTLKNITVVTDATGANGVFSYGGSATTNNSSSDGTTITISDSKITTTKDNSGGIMTTGGGVMVASNLTVHTAGISSAAIRTDRGGGTVTVDGGTYTTTGAGSPTVYSTADVTVRNSTLTAMASEGIVIEGANSVTIENCNLTDTNNQLNGQSTTYKNIFLYQSMSGDAASGNAEFTASDSTITTNQGDSFYVTNTTASIRLENNTIVNHDTDGNFLRAQTDSWGNSGSNGGNVVLNMIQQKVAGNIVIDSISTLDMTMKSNSYYEGTINGDNSAKSISLALDSSSNIKLTGDSYVTSLKNEDSSNSNIDFNGYQLYVNGKVVS